MMDNKTRISELKAQVQRFCEERDWDRYHGAKDLAVAIITESAELLDHFRFKSAEEVEALLEKPEKREEISDEMADIFYFLLRLAQRYDIDLTAELKRKMEQNAKRYPVEKSRSSNKKYTEL